MEKRNEILRNSRIILMTPDVVHAWLMSNLREPRIARFLGHLRLVILDEAHVYEGVFGTNMAYLNRRLDVATSSRHRILCSTATLGKSSDFMCQLTGRTTVAIAQEQDGSPAPGRTVLLAKDPGFDRTVDLLKRLAALEGGRFLAFADSRKVVEHVVAATMRIETPPVTDDVEPDEDQQLDDEPEAPRPNGDGSHRILPYRAGYEVEDAKEIQNALWQGKLGGVVSTSAMELGLDIGEIDLVVIMGLPSSQKAFWQRLGRAGRKREGVCLLLDSKGALTATAGGLSNYASKDLEPSYLYLGNRYLQYANVLCAASECADLGIHSANQDAYKTLPSQFTRLLENELNPTEVVPADLYPLKQRSQAGPHREFPLRSGIETNFKVETAQGFQLGNLTLSQMMREAYPGGIYYYMARPYRVVHLDTRSAHIRARRERHWTTRPLSNTMVFPRFNGGVLSIWGDDSAFLVESELQVSERVTGFQEQRGGKKMEPQIFGPGSPWYRRELTRFFETTGVCWQVPLRVALTEEVGALLLQVFCFEHGVQERDLGVGIFHSKVSPFNSAGKFHGLCIYDAVNGSLRLTQRLAENFAEVVLATAKRADAEGRSELSSQLHEFHSICTDLVPTSSGNRYSEVRSVGEWAQIIAPGEKAIYVSEDGPREVTVIGYRFTPKGLIYDLVPEEAGAKWMVVAHALQPMHGFTRLLEVDLMTGEEREQTYSSATESKTAAEESNKYNIPDQATLRTSPSA
jgi:DEAD/DEAH box helicase domain-containing protein